MSIRTVLALSALALGGCVADREPLTPSSINPASGDHASAPRSDWADPLLQSETVVPPAPAPAPAHQHQHGGGQ